MHIDRMGSEGEKKCVKLRCELSKEHERRMQDVGSLEVWSVCLVLVLVNADVQCERERKQDWRRRLFNTIQKSVEGAKRQSGRTKRYARRKRDTGVEDEGDCRGQIKTECLCKEAWTLREPPFKAS